MGIRVPNTKSTLATLHNRAGSTFPCSVNMVTWVPQRPYKEGVITHDTLQGAAFETQRQYVMHSGRDHRLMAYYIPFPAPSGQRKGW